MLSFSDENFTPVSFGDVLHENAINEMITVSAKFNLFILYKRVFVIDLLFIGAKGTIFSLYFP